MTSREDFEATFKPLRYRMMQERGEYVVTDTYRWVRLKQHCSATGDTPDAVHARRRKRQWQDGVQCRVGPDGNLYVSPQEYNKWVESQPAQQSCESQGA